MKRVDYSRAALKVLTRMPANQGRLIRSRIEAYAADPVSLANNVIALKGEPGILLMRIGDCGCFFAIAPVPWRSFAYRRAAAHMSDMR